VKTWNISEKEGSFTQAASCGCPVGTYLRAFPEKAECVDLTKARFQSLLSLDNKSITIPAIDINSESCPTGVINMAALSTNPKKLYFYCSSVDYVIPSDYTVVINCSGSGNYISTIQADTASISFICSNSQTTTKKLILSTGMVETSTTGSTPALICSNDKFPIKIEKSSSTLVMHCGVPINDY
jgi:hypothetical protein